MDRPTSAPSLPTPNAPNPAVQAIIEHLCQDPCHAYGAVLEWCESRGDCVSAVVCPSCSTQFVVDDDELAELQRWTDQQGQLFVCGIRVD
ncbi:MAG: MJ0042-type zinc finger domain-containing protein [Thermomicrobiales bacterium]|jgi:hypothetical protein